MSTYCLFTALSRFTGSGTHRSPEIISPRFLTHNSNDDERVFNSVFAFCKSFLTTSKLLCTKLVVAILLLLSVESGGDEVIVTPLKLILPALSINKLLLRASFVSVESFCIWDVTILLAVKEPLDKISPVCELKTIVTSLLLIARPLLTHIAVL